MAVTTDTSALTSKAAATTARVGLSAIDIAALAIAFSSRIALVIVVWLSLHIFARWPLYPAQYPDSFFPKYTVLDGWARWDAAHYVNLAQFGYGSDNPSPHGGLGFFPLYSLLMRGLVEIFRVSPTPAHLAFAGIVIANLCFFIAVPLLTRKASQQFGETAAHNAVLLLCIVPF